MTLSSGTRLGPYEILSALGAGGMGEVYRARDARLRREVALKVLPDLFAGNPDRLARFEREAHLLASLNHPHIAQIYGFEESGEVRALVMELIDGPTLADRIAEGPIPLEEALVIAIQIAGALEAAHERGIVHRDLKPANIKVRTDGTVKVLDFGLGKALDADPGSNIEGMNSPTLTARATEAGVMLGTAAYMAPEQVKCKAVDTRADIWAFGVVLFEMLTRRRPFPGGEVSDVLADILRSEPAWPALPERTPAAVRRLLRRCLQKDPRRRLQHIGDARLDLEEAQAPDALTAALPQPIRRWPVSLAWGITGLSLLVAAGVVTAWLGSRSSAPPQDAMRFSTVTSFSGVEAQPSLSPDGRSVAFVSNRDGQWDIYVGLVTGGSLIRITQDPNVETRPDWSPDGTRIAFGRLNERGLHDIWIVPAFGGAARRILTNAFHPAWSPDGRSLGYSSGGSIWIADASGANARRVTDPGAFPSDYQPSFSRNGQSLACVRRRGGGQAGPYGALIVVDVATGTVRYLTQDDALPLSPVWSNDDQFIYFTWSRGGALNVWKIPAPGGEPVQITAGQGDDAQIDLSADGTQLVFSSFRFNVNLAEMSLDRRTGGRVTWLTSDSARGENRPTYSPDGRRIAFFSNRIGAERESLWLMDADGANASRLVEEEGRLSIFPRWTGDGQELIFMSRTASRSGVAAMDEIGELRRVSVNGGAPQSLPIKPWSPAWGDIAADGRIIYRRSSVAGEVYDPRTQQRQPVTDLRGDPVWSRDGRSFAFLVRPGLGKAEDAGVYVEMLSGGRRQVFRGWAVGFAWGNGDELLVLEGKPDLKGVLWRMDPQGQRREIVLDVVPLFLTHAHIDIPPARFDVHPGGTRMVIEALESFEADIGMITNVR